MSHVREAGGREILMPRLIKVKERRNSPTQKEIVEEVTDLGLTVPNNCLRIVTPVGSREKLDSTNIPGEVVKYMISQRITEQLENGKKQADMGDLTFEMEQFLIRHGKTIEVRPQKWQCQRKEAF